MVVDKFEQLHKSMNENGLPPTFFMGDIVSPMSRRGLRALLKYEPDQAHDGMDHVLKTPYAFGGTGHAGVFVFEQAGLDKEQQIEWLCQYGIVVSVLDELILSSFSIYTMTCARALRSGQNFSFVGRDKVRSKEYDDDNIKVGVATVGVDSSKQLNVVGMNAMKILLSRSAL